MDGRIKGLICFGLLAALSGCNSLNKTKTPEPYQNPTAQPQGNMVSRFFGPSTPTHTPSPDMIPVVRDRSKDGKGLGAESEVALAVASHDAAYMKTSALERDQMLDMARQRYQQALKTDPKNRNALVGLGRFYAATGDKANAVATLRNAANLYPNDHELYHRLAAVHFQFGEPNEAIQATQHALRIDPNNRTYLKTMALCQGQLNQWEAAHRTLVESRVMTESESRYFLGRALIDLGHTQQGQEQITVAAQDPNNPLPAQYLRDLAAGFPANGVQTVGHETTDEAAR
ncbi:MAG: tetratricopeptide repeat protein [Fimbriiglobus sp.]